jgi:hypothetical protein
LVGLLGYDKLSAWLAGRIRWSVRWLDKVVR